MVGGFQHPTHGRIFVGGEDVTGVPVEKRGIGMVFQNYALFPNMSVGENIAFPLTVRRLPRAEIAQKVARGLASVRVEGRTATSRPRSPGRSFASRAACCPRSRWARSTGSCASRCNTS